MKRLKAKDSASCIIMMSGSYKLATLYVVITICMYYYVLTVLQNPRTAWFGRIWGCFTWSVEQYNW